MSAMEKRSLAMEYCRLCSEAESVLEHCIALIKAGREYPALQVAETSSLLESLNALIFQESDRWREYCAVEGLPYPSTFDNGQIALLNSLYTKGVTQTHPLYRDYRRAMRMRKYEDALSIIKTISKINSYDAEARNEYNRLLKLVVRTKLEALSEAMKSGGENFYELMDFIGANEDCVGKSQVWLDAQTYRAERIREREAAQCEKILKELNTLDATRDWERVIELVADFNSLRGDKTFSDSDITKMEELCSSASKIQDEIIQAQRVKEAHSKAAQELETPTIKPSSARLKTLSKLRSLCGDSMDESLKARLNSEIFKLRLRGFISTFVKTGVAVCAIAALASVGVFAWNIFKSSKEKSSATERMAVIEKIRDLSQGEKFLAQFEADFPALAKQQPFVGRLEQVRTDFKLRGAELARIEKSLDRIEKIDAAKAATSEIESASADLEKTSKDLNSVERADSIKLTDRLEAVTKKFRQAVSERRKMQGTLTGQLLSEFEALLPKYALAELGDKSVDEEFDNVFARLSALIEDTTNLFKASAMDIARFSETSAKLKSVREARGKYLSLADDLKKSKSLADYFATAESMKALADFLPPKFISQLDNAIKNKSALKNIFAFGLKNINTPLDEVSDAPFSKAVFTQDRLLTDVYRYKKVSRATRDVVDVFTRGSVSEQTNNWSGGTETMQQADEISYGGVVSKVLYRMQELKGASARGESLVGGGLTAESQAGRLALRMASEKSLLAALNYIIAADVNPIYKLLLEQAVFAKLSQDAVGSGLAYSPSAVKRKAAVDKAAEKFFAYSWLFEGSPKKSLIKNQFYSEENVPNFESEANTLRGAVATAKSNPPKFVGVADENGNFDGELSGVAIGFAADGELRKISAGTQKPRFAAFSPIFIETVSIEDLINKQDNQSVKK